jgi:integrase
MVSHRIGLIGTIKLAGLKVRDVDFALGKLAKRLSTRSVRLARMILIQAIRNAMVNDLVVRNVADLAAVPTGRPGRPSKSLTLDQALAVLDAAKGERLWPYVAVSMLGGIRTEEAHALRCTRPGGPMHATDVRMEFKRITEKAGLGRDWTPRELRHTFVSLVPDSGVPTEQIADAVGHSSTRTTEVVYRHQLRPVTRTAAIALGPLFESKGTTNGGQS